MSLFWGLKISLTKPDTPALNLKPPFVLVLPNPFKTASVVASATGICRIIGVINSPKIAYSIIRPISVAMIDHFSGPVYVYPGQHMSVITTFVYLYLYVSVACV